MHKSKKPWLTKDVMHQVYEQKLWGGNNVDYYSGEGSHRTEIVQSYLDVVISFLISHNNTLTICDLGCGDFNIGKHFIKHSKKYFAIDIVPNLIERNKSIFKAENLEFKCLDISTNELPNADCIILRQVLQHLSNAEIIKILNKLKDYKYIILTEHLPVGNFIPNKDKIVSQGIRLKQNSGVDILIAPFNFKVKSFEVLDEVILENKKGKIVTTLYNL